MKEFDDNACSSEVLVVIAPAPESKKDWRRTEGVEIASASASSELQPVGLTRQGRLFFDSIAPCITSTFGRRCPSLPRPEPNNS